MPAPAASARRHRGWWMLSLLAFVWPWGLAGEGVPFFFEADSCGVVVGRECGVVWASRSMFISCVRLLFCLILVFLSFYVDIRCRSPEDTPPLLLHVGILPSQSLIGGYKWGEGGGRERPSLPPQPRPPPPPSPPPLLPPPLSRPSAIAAHAVDPVRSVLNTRGIILRTDATARRGSSRGGRRGG